MKPHWGNLYVNEDYSLLPIPDTSVFYCSQHFASDCGSCGIQHTVDVAEDCSTKKNYSNYEIVLACHFHISCTSIRKDENE